MTPMLKPNYNKEWFFFCSDRVGTDKDTSFNGCSSAIKMQEIVLLTCFSFDKE